MHTNCMMISILQHSSSPLLPLMRKFYVSSIGSNIINDPIFSLLQVPVNLKNIDLRTLHAYTITSGLIRDTIAASRVVELCFKSKSSHPSPNYASVIFESIHEPDVYTWNVMIIGQAEHESPESGIMYYFKMLLHRLPPNNYTFALIIKACVMLYRNSTSSRCITGTGDDTILGRKVHGQILKHGVENLLVVRNSLTNMYCTMGCLREAQLLFNKSPSLDLISWNSMISAYGKVGDVKAARELFEKMPERSMVSWSAMIDGYVRSGGYFEALSLFNDMQAIGVKPDAVILVSVLKASANLGAIDQGRRIHDYIDRNKLGKEKNVILGTALVDMYAKCGCIDVALELFNGMHDKDAVLWNAMISGLASHGHGQDALELFRRMKSHGTMVPNATTFLTVLCACAHSGMVAEGVEIFEFMKTYNIEPGVEHYGCLADILGRAGLVQEAEKVLCSMPMEPQASQWGALMAACRTHNNVEVGERIGKRLIVLEPHDGGRYIQLSNIYASAGQWEDAHRTRREMEQMGAKKERGCSLNIG